jgi:hypothetical protein
VLPLLVSRAQADALREVELPARSAIGRLKDRHESAAVFFIRRIEKLAGNDFTHEALHDGVDATYVLRPVAGTLSRTSAKEPSVPVVYQEASIRRDRPDLRKEVLRPPVAVRLVSPKEGRRLLDLARGAMVTRARDLDAFAYGDARDVRVVDDGGGLAFIAVGVTPERRALLPAIYGYLTLRNGVPIGYVQTDAIGGWAAVAFNTFDAFRGGEAAYVFARVLAMTRHLFGATSFRSSPISLAPAISRGSLRERGGSTTRWDSGRAMVKCAAWCGASSARCDGTIATVRARRCSRRSPAVISSSISIRAGRATCRPWPRSAC